jgi:hypothetical protein
VLPKCIGSEGIIQSRISATKDLWGTSAALTQGSLQCCSKPARRASIDPIWAKGLGLNFKTLPDQESTDPWPNLTLCVCRLAKTACRC